MPPLKLSDYFQPSLPASGGFTVANTTPAFLPRKPVPQLNVKAPSSLTQLSIGPMPSPALTLPPNSPLAAAYGVTPAAPVRAPAAPAGAPSGGSGPLFPPAGTGGSTGPTGATAPAAAPIPPSWLNADGTIKTPDQIAHEAGSALESAHNNPDVGTLAVEQFGANGQTTEQAIAEARKIGNARNDLAVGETDPYKIASQSGIAYTSAELSAIEKAYAGIYDPALDTALAKVQDKQDADKLAAQVKADNEKPYTLGKDEVRYDKDGNPVAVGIPSDSGGPTGPYVKGANPVVDAYVEGFNNGTYKASDIPDEYKGLVAEGAAATKPSLSKSSIDAISNIDALLNATNLEDISGIRLFDPSSYIPGTAAQVTQNTAKQLKGILSLENRTQLKGSGAISDFEFRVLGDAASSLGIDDNGRTNLSPEEFKKQLTKMKLKLEVGPTDLTDDELQHLNDQGYTPDQIREYSHSQAFNSVGNTTASKTALNRPQRNNNPGNVKAGGLSDSLAIGVDEQGHLKFPDAATGFKALTADLTAKINGGSKYLPANPTIAQLGKVYAEDPNWPKKVAAILGVPVDTHTAAVPLANLAKAVATQEGFYA